MSNQVRLLLVTLLIAWSSLTLRSQEPIDIGDRKQLFFDHRFISSSEGIVLRANSAQKLGALVGPDGNPLIGFVSRVIEDNGKIRLYLGHDGVEIFESDDGIRFKSTGKSIGAVASRQSSWTCMIPTQISVTNSFF